MMTSLQLKALKKSEDLVEECIKRIFTLEEHRSKTTLEVVYRELGGIKNNLIEVENWIRAIIKNK